MPETTTAPDEAAAPATDVIESATAEAAIAEVHARHGADARIVEARRVLRGGIGGFFAKEHVQLHVAAAPEPEFPSPEPPAPEARASASSSTTSVTAPRADSDSPVDRLLLGADDLDDTVDFATYLRSQLAVPEPREEAEPSTAPAPATAAAPAPPVAAPAPPVAAPTPVPVVTAAVTSDDPAWSTTRLQHLGLPAGLVAGLEVLDGADDLAWTRALTEALQPLCRPLPAGEAVLIGARASELATVADAPAARSRAWLSALGDHRWRHLVLGGDAWRDHLEAAPLAVSWTCPEELPDTLRCAWELGLVLGYGPMGGQLRRARPLEVALAVRALVGRR